MRYACQARGSDRFTDTVAVNRVDHRVIVLFASAGREDEGIGSRDCGGQVIFRNGGDIAESPTDTKSLELRKLVGVTVKTGHFITLLYKEASNARSCSASDTYDEHFHSKLLAIKISLRLHADTAFVRFMGE